MPITFKGSTNWRRRRYMMKKNFESYRHVVANHWCNYNWTLDFTSENVSNDACFITHGKWKVQGYIGSITFLCNTFLGICTGYDVVIMFDKFYVFCHDTIIFQSDVCNISRWTIFHWKGVGDKYLIKDFKGKFYSKSTCSKFLPIVMKFGT